MLVFEFHNRFYWGYIDLHIPSKRRELFYLCFDWQVHKVIVAIGQEIRDHWFKFYYPFLRHRKINKEIRFKITRSWEA